MSASAAAAAERKQYRRAEPNSRALHRVANSRFWKLIGSGGAEAAMRVVVGPVVTRDGGFAFDSWTPEGGLSRGYSYRRIEDAHYARKVQIRAAIGRPFGPMVACNTIDEFVSALAGRIETAAMARHL